MCQGSTMNFTNYRAYVKNKQTNQKKVLAILAESLEEVKQLLENKYYDVKNVDELVFVTSKGERLVTFNVSKYVLFGKI